MNFRNYFLLCLMQVSNEVMFERSIEATGMSYYKICFQIGTCQENLLFSEYKAWPMARMNRILDIYYKSDIEQITVSSVEIKLVLNNTDCVGTSELGVGFPEFSATLFFSTNMAAIFYSLKIFTCSRTFNLIVEDKDSLINNDNYFEYKNNPEELNEDED